MSIFFVAIIIVKINIKRCLTCLGISALFRFLPKGLNQSASPIVAYLVILIELAQYIFHLGLSELSLALRVKHRKPSFIHFLFLLDIPVSERVNLRRVVIIEDGQ